jgi:hypothetical protein
VGILNRGNRRRSSPANDPAQCEKILAPMRRKNPNRLNWDIKDIRLKKSELRDLVDLLRSEQPESIDVETSDYEFRDVDELVGRMPASTTEVKFTAHLARGRTLWVTLKHDAATIWGFGSSDNALQGVISKVSDYLAGRRRRPREGVRKALSLLGLAVYSNILDSVIQHYYHRTFSGRALTVVVLALVWIIPTTDLPWTKKAIAFRKEDNERKPIHWRGVGWDLLKIGLAGGLGFLAGMYKSDKQPAAQNQSPPPAAAAQSTIR